MPEKSKDISLNAEQGEHSKTPVELSPEALSSVCQPVVPESSASGSGAATTTPDLAKSFTSLDGASPLNACDSGLLRGARDFLSTANGRSLTSSGSFTGLVKVDSYRNRVMVAGVERPKPEVRR